MRGLIIILINWQDEQLTLQCVRSLRNWQKLRPEIIVVDNQSTKTSREKLSNELTGNELICNSKNLGYAGGNNLAIKQALLKKKNYILLLNTDAEISEAAVTKLLDRLNRYPEISILGPVILEGQNSDITCLIGGRDIAKHQFTRIAAKPGALKTMADYPLCDVDYVSGTVFLTRREVFEEVGCLDERYFFSGEIADFCKRARNKGHKVCTDLAVRAYHHTGKTAVELRDSLYMYYTLRNRFLYVKKHYPAKKLGYFSHWLKAGGQQLISAALKGEMTRARAVFLALKHALLNQFGNQNDKFI